MREKEGIILTKIKYESSFLFVFLFMRLSKKIVNISLEKMSSKLLAKAFSYVSIDLDVGILITNLYRKSF